MQALAPDNATHMCTSRGKAGVLHSVGKPPVSRFLWSPLLRKKSRNQQRHQLVRTRHSGHSQVHQIGEALCPDRRQRPCQHIFVENEGLQLRKPRGPRGRQRARQAAIDQPPAPRRSQDLPARGWKAQGMPGAGATTLTGRACGERTAATPRAGWCCLQGPSSRLCWRAGATAQCQIECQRALAEAVWIDPSLENRAWSTHTLCS